MLLERGGSHGYDNRNSDMYSIFYTAGPAFRKNYRFDKLCNVDIYNLICVILDVAPAPNDGNRDNLRNLLRKRQK